MNNDIKDKKNENIIQNNNNKETEGGLVNKAKIFESNQVNKTVSSSCCIKSSYCLILSGFFPK